MCEAAVPVVDATYMQGRVLQAAAEVGLADASVTRLLNKLFFAQPNLAGLSDTHANFLPYLLDKWRSPRKVVAADGAGMQS